MNITKKIISKNISNSIKISLKESNAFLDSFLRIVKDESKTKVIKIGNFGTFSYKYTPKRIGRNPKTGSAYVIKPFNRYVFKASFRLKSFLN